MYIQISLKDVGKIGSNEANKPPTTAVFQIITAMGIFREMLFRIESS